MVEVKISHNTAQGGAAYGPRHYSTQSSGSIQIPGRGVGLSNVPTWDDPDQGPVVRITSLARSLPGEPRKRVEKEREKQARL